MKQTIKIQLENLGKTLIPKGWRFSFINYTASAGILRTPYHWISILFIIAMLFTTFLFVYFDIYSVISQYNTFSISVIVFMFFLIIGSLFTSVIMGGAYFYLNMRIYKRTQIIEDNLTEYLVLVSTNLKGGLSFEKSLWGAIKPEFSILSEEMSLVSKKVMTGSDLQDALQELAEKYESPNLKRTINIITGELDSGGKIAYVLDDIIKNLRKTKTLKDEMSANTLMFTIFISAIVLFISPVLFSLAFNLLNVLISVSQMLGGVGGGGEAMGGVANIDFGEIELDPELFQTFSVAALAVISLFASMIISIIQKGDVKGGIKYLPFFIVTSTVFYWIVMGAMEGFFDFI